MRLDTHLRHHTTYQYKVAAENKVGLGESDIVDAKTAQAKPDDVHSPEWISEDRKRIILTWKPPGKPNGTFQF